MVLDAARAISRHIRGEIINTILYYLSLMDKKYVFNEDTQVIEVMEKIGEEEYKIFITIKGVWIISLYVGPSIADLDPEKKSELMYKLLKMNREMMEMKISLDKDDRIIITVESSIVSLTFDNFYIEFNAIPYAIMELHKILASIFG